MINYIKEYTKVTTFILDAMTSHDIIHAFMDTTDDEVMEVRIDT